MMNIFALKKRMIVEIAWIIAKIIGVLILVVALRIVQIHFRVKAQIARLVSQGMTSMPGNDSTFGPVADISAKREDDAKKKSQGPFLTCALATLAEKDRNPNMPAYDASKHPMVVMNLGGKAVVSVADPEAVQDFYTKQ